MNAGGVVAMVDYVEETKGSCRIPGIMMLGYTAAHSEVLAMAVIGSKVVLQTNLDFPLRTIEGLLSAEAVTAVMHAFI